jgi:carbon-monoxide dehydrogenase iron sulfur subunit
MAQKRLIVTPSRCIGCRSCELACAFVHAKTPSQPALPRVRTYTFAEDMNMVILCLQCEEAACQKVCPTDALVRSEQTGAIEVIQDRCIRCLACTLACPFGNIYLDVQVNEVVKCDVCKGNPACVLFCPSMALEYASEPSKDVPPVPKGVVRPVIPGFPPMQQLPITGTEY